MCKMQYYKSYKRQLLNHTIISWKQLKTSTFFSYYLYLKPVAVFFKINFNFLSSYYSKYML